LAQLVTIQLSAQSTSPGPYTVYDYTNGTLLQSNASLFDLQAGVIKNVPDNTNQISIVNQNPACLGRTVIRNIPPFSSPSPTPSLTPNASLTPTPTITPTATPSITTTPSATPQPTATPSPTPTPTITPSVPQVSITVRLTIDAGNTGYATLYTGGAVQIGSSLTSTSQYTFSTVNGGQFYVSVFQTSRAFSYQMSTIYNYINGAPDACSPYYQTVLNTENKTFCGGSYTTATLGNSYLIDCYIGNQR